jgi:cytochrome c-type biogenesis protein CcmH
MSALALGALALVSTELPAGEARPLAEDPALEERLNRLAAELRCLVCQNESIAGSRADLAQDLRQEVRELMKAGRSDAEVTAFLTERYGDFILYRPPVRPGTWLLWFGPALILAGAVAGMVFAARRRPGRHEGGPGPEARSRAARLLKLDEESST